MNLGTFLFRFGDYHAFGMQMAGRGIKGDYRYGYQGSELDNELAGAGNSYTTEFRQLDPRLGRWFSVDPVFQPWQSPYTSMDNNPVNGVDTEGGKFVTYTEQDKKDLAEYKEVLSQTAEGRKVLEHIENSSTRILIRFTDAIIIYRNGTTQNNGELEGVRTDLMVNRNTGQTITQNMYNGLTAEEKLDFEPVQQILISKGYHHFRNFYREETGNELDDIDRTDQKKVDELNILRKKFYFGDLSNGNTPDSRFAGFVDENNTNVTSMFNRNNIGNVATLNTEWDKTYHPSKVLWEQAKALKNESMQEFITRVGVHEGQHVITNDRINEWEQENPSQTHIENRNQRTREAASYRAQRKANGELREGRRHETNKNDKNQEDDY